MPLYNQVHPPSFDTALPEVHNLHMGVIVDLPSLFPEPVAPIYFFGIHE